MLNFVECNINHVHRQKHNEDYCGPHRLGQPPILVLKASENSICRVVCLVVLKFVSLFYQGCLPFDGKFRKFRVEGKW